MYLSFENRGAGINSWLKKRLIRLLEGYWFIVILSWIICMTIDGRPLKVYFDGVSILNGIWNMIIEFLGLGGLVGNEMLNGSWWYMSAAIVFIVITPLLYKALTSLGSGCVIALCFIVPRLFGYLGGTHWLSFLLVFIFGMVFAKEELFLRWNNFVVGGTFANQVKFIILFALCFIGYKLYYHLPTAQYWDIKYGVIPVLIILFAKEYVASMPMVSVVLAFLGKHSANIWLIHNFIRVYYCEVFTYSMGHFVAILIVLLLISLCISIIIEYLKRLIDYDKLIRGLLVTN